MCVIDSVVIVFVDKLEILSFFQIKSDFFSREQLLLVFKKSMILWESKGLTPLREVDDLLKILKVLVSFHEFAHGLVDARLELRLLH